MKMLSRGTPVKCRPLKAGVNENSTCKIICSPLYSITVNIYASFHCCVFTTSFFNLTEVKTCLLCQLLNFGQGICIGWIWLQKYVNLINVFWKTYLLTSHFHLFPDVHLHRPNRNNVDGYLQFSLNSGKYAKQFNLISLFILMKWNIKTETVYLKSLIAYM